MVLLPKFYFAIFYSTIYLLLKCICNYLPDSNLLFDQKLSVQESEAMTFKYLICIKCKKL